MTTKISGAQIQNYTVETEQLSNTAVAAFAKSLAPKITTVNVANSSYTVLDDTAVNVGGGYIVITGAEFQSGASVLIDATPATSVTYINSTTLRAEVPSKSAASYNLYVVNPDGGTGIRVAGITYSATPTWVTASPLSNQPANVSFNVSLSATSATSYSNTTALPADTQLLSNGYFYGTVTIGAETTYTFTVRATDAELQDADKTFQVTVTVGPPPGSLYILAWLSEFGGSGLNDTVSRSSPVQLGSSTNWSTLVTRGNNVAAIKTDGTLWTWGYNVQGQLGLNAIVNISSPVQVGASTNWSSVSESTFAYCSIKTDGTLWVWGTASSGKLGLNSITVNRSSPTQVGSATNWSKVVGDYGSRFFALKTDGTLWGWGNNTWGELGLGDRINRSSPTQVAGTTWNNIWAGRTHVMASKTDNTIWGWGYVAAGSLGNNSIVNRSSPVQVLSTIDWSKLVLGDYFTVGLKSNGTLWSWGGDTYGRLGLNSRNVYRSSPTQIGSNTTWSNVFLEPGSSSPIAIKTDGTLWVWGGYMGNLLNLPLATYRSSPVQIGTQTYWANTNIFGTNYAYLAKF